MSSTAHRATSWSLTIALATLGAVACGASSDDPGAAGESAQAVGVSQSEFQERIQETLSAFSTAIGHQGATFQIQADWDDPKLNAGTNRDGSVWFFYFTGGLARLPGMTPDAYTIVTCHEMGHELGGYPFAQNDYVAAGGQADYFATHVCARLLWQEDAETNKTFRDRVPRFEKALCDQAWSDIPQQNLCYRIMVASAEAAAAISQVEGAPRAPAVATPDTRSVESVFLGHPAAQCRLDTFVNGALCTLPGNPMVIPGDAERVGGLSASSQERASLPYACAPTHRAFDGARPACWFKSLADQD